MSVTGSGTAQLMALAGKCRRLGDQMPKIAAEMRTASLALNRQSFNARQSPEGDGWVNGPYYRGLRGKTGRLLSSMRSHGTGLAFGVRTGARYAWYHQHGAVLRDAIVGSAGKLRTRRRGPGKGKEGPTRKYRASGPLRKGRERGFLPARPIVPSGDVPARWQTPLMSIADRRIRRALGF